MAHDSTWPAGEPIPERKKESWPAADQEALPLREENPVSGPFFRKHAVDTRPWTDATRRNVEKAYGKFLAYLSAVEPHALSIPPAERLTYDRCMRYSEALAASGLAVSSQGFHLAHLAMAHRRRNLAPAGRYAGSGQT